MGYSYNLAHSIGHWSLVLAMIFLVSANVLAFAISAPYSKDNPLKMYPGETRDVSFSMQNLEGSDTNVVVSLVDGKNVAEITSGTNYAMPLGTSDKSIVLRIRIPSDATVGNTYNVKFSVQSSPEGKEGNIQLGVGYNVDFPIIIMEKVSYPTPIPQEVGQQTKSNNTWAIVIIILVVIGLIVWALKRLKK